MNAGRRKVTDDALRFARLQELPPKAAHFCLRVERFCREDLGFVCAGESVVAAYSGGADSKALLFCLCYLASRLGLSVQAAILDHGLRREAEAEVRDASAVCSRLGVVLHVQKRDVAALAKESGVGVEEAGRNARLEFLEEIRQKTDSAWIAVGHQLNDLAEDCVMRMLRGTGWPALGGMAGIDPKRHIVRPLLLTPRAELELFLRSIHEPWHDDAMNNDDAFLRNRVRNHILPLFFQENPSFLDTVADRWRMARKDEIFLANRMEAVCAQEKEAGVFLPREALLRADAAIRLRKYKQILSTLAPGQVSASLLRALDEAWLRNEGGKTIQFSGGKRARIQNGGVFFAKNKRSGSA